MKVLLPFLRSAYAFRSVQLSAMEQPMERFSTTTTTTTTGLARQLPPLAPGSRRVILVRHAETDWNARGLLQGGGFDVELNEAGKEQAQALADELRQTLPPKVDVVVASSHLARASETADIVSQAFFDDTPMTIRIINHKFGEMRFGDWEGLAIRGPDCTDETRQKFRDFNNIMHENKSIAWPGSGGESIQDVEQRAEAGLAQILRGFPDCDHFCVVGHGRFNKILLMSLLGLTGKDSIQQGNTGVNVLDMDVHGNWKAHAINYMEHVMQKAKTSNE